MEVQQYDRLSGEQQYARGKRHRGASLLEERGGRLFEVFHRRGAVLDLKTAAHRHSIPNGVLTSCITRGAASLNGDPAEYVNIIKLTYRLVKRGGPRKHQNAVAPALHKAVKGSNDIPELDRLRYGIVFLTSSATGIRQVGEDLFTRTMAEAVDTGPFFEKAFALIDTDKSLSRAFPWVLARFLETPNYINLHAYADIHTKITDIIARKGFSSKQRTAILAILPQGQFQRSYELLQREQTSPALAHTSIRLML